MDTHTRSSPANDQCRCWHCGTEYVHLPALSKFGPPCTCVDLLGMIDDGCPIVSDCDLTNADKVTETGVAAHASSQSR